MKTIEKIKELPLVERKIVIAILSDLGLMEYENSKKLSYMIQEHFSRKNNDNEISWKFNKEKNVLIQQIKTLLNE